MDIENEIHFQLESSDFDASGIYHHAPRRG
jgi:hypothetical protein